MTDDRLRKAEDALGHPGRDHQLARQEEQRDRQQREIVHPADEELRHHLERQSGPGDEQRQHRRGQQREDQRHPEQR